MSRLWKAVQRIWCSTQNITKSIFKTAGKGTSRTVQATANTAARIISIILLAVIMITILAVSLPWGIFGGFYVSNQDVVSKTG